ncbi:MAG: SDR family oxidoreductase [Rhodospirillales bacterium]|nr:SDR family oxidoreductase [Rhodospirillales bacterium]
MAASKIAMVTGAGTGVGRAVSLALMKAGFTVVLVGRRKEMLEETQNFGKQAGGTSHAIPTDVSDPAAVNKLFAEIKAKYGRLDFLFNNAGMGTGVPFEDLTFEQWKQVVDVNLTGSFLCAQGAFRMMKEQKPQGGRIVNNGSISAHTPRPNSAPYTSTKHAITGLTKSISLDGRKYDITCGQIDIGNAATPMTARMAGGVPQANGTMMPEPTMNADHVGDAVVYMANLPPDANVHTITVMASKMPFVGRG